MSAPETPATAETASLELAAAAGIHALAIPTPFLVGRFNCYLIERSEEHTTELKTQRDISYDV